MTPALNRWASLDRLALGARVFGLAVLVPPFAASRETGAAVALVALGTIWFSALVVERFRGLSPMVVPLGEAALVGIVGGLALDTSLAVLGALAVPPFVASLRRGRRGLMLALSLELVALVTVSIAIRGLLDAESAAVAFTWVVVGTGLGLIGSFLRSSLDNDPLAPYRDAQSLLRELIDLSGRLGSGLDPATLAATVAEAVRDELPVSALLVAAPGDGGLRALLTELGTGPRSLDPLTDLAYSAARQGEPVRAGTYLAFPLTTDAGLVAVVACRLPAQIGAPVTGPLTGPGSRVAALVQRLEPTAVHLDTALLFSAFRDAAVSDERRRVAREMHDGLAQDIASLGYLVDAISARAADDAQAGQLRLLRDRLSAIVGEVRQSVQTLRTDVRANDSLGAAIGRLARHLSAGSGLSIHVSVEEGTVRLRHDVEAELLRIAQEAMTNAVRHSGGRRIDVSCRVQAPEAEIVVRDDGRGLGPRRHDSYGLDIMHERARLVGATLTVRDGSPGTLVRVATPGMAVALSDRKVIA